MWTQKFHNPFTFLKLEFNASWLLFNNIVIILKLEGKEKREFILKIRKKNHSNVGSTGFSILKTLSNAVWA